jgi:hypothetical protein
MFHVKHLTPGVFLVWLGSLLPGLGKPLSGLFQLRHLAFGFEFPIFSTLLVELRIMHFRHALGSLVFDATTMAQNTAIELAKLLIEKRRCLGHQREFSNVQLILKDRKQDIRQPVEFFDLTLG